MSLEKQCIYKKRSTTRIRVFLIRLIKLYETVQPAEVYIYLKYNFFVSAYPGCYRDDQARIWPTDSTDPGKRIILGTTNSPAK